MAKPLTSAAERALAEAAARRAAAEKRAGTPQGSERPEGAGADPLWRLGAQRDRKRLLSNPAAQDLVSSRPGFSRPSTSCLVS